MPNRDPEQEARRITASYLNSKGWASAWQQTYVTDVRRLKQKETMAERFARADKSIEEAEARFLNEIDALEKEAAPSAKQTLKAIIRILDPRTDISPMVRSAVNLLKRDIH